MKIIDVVTKRQDELCGCWWGEDFRDTVVITTNGTAGNVFENKFLRDVAETLEQSGISFIYAHNSGAFKLIDMPSKSGHGLGVAYEQFDDCVEDLQAYVDFAKRVGYKRIILGGHSYGANKVVYYLYKTKSKDIDKFILISPTDTEYHTEGETKSIAEFNAYIALNNPAKDEIIPLLFDKYNFYATQGYLDFLNNPHHNNLPVYSDKKGFAQLKSIAIPGLFVMGDRDPFAKRDAATHLQTILKHSNQKAQNKAVVIEGTIHTFRHRSAELARAILDFVKA